MDDVLRETLERMSEDARQLLDWEAQRLTRLRRESGIIELDLDTTLCSGHDHDDERG